MSKIVSTFIIKGMTCDACQKLVEKKLSRIEPSITVKVDRTTGQADISAERGIEAIEVKNALQNTHYTLAE